MNISKPILWLDKTGMREYQPDDAKRIYKWALFRHDSTLRLVAMPEGLMVLLHAYLVIETALALKLCTQAQWEAAHMANGTAPERVAALGIGLEVLGGGTKNSRGEISHSHHFGPVPYAYVAEIKKLLNY